MESLRISWIGRQVTDIARQRRFLEGQLGLTVRGAGRSTWGNSVTYDADTVGIALIEQPSASEIPNFWTLAFEVDDVAATIEGMGLPINGVVYASWGAYATLRDPDGVPWYLAHDRRHPPVGATAPGRVGWVSLTVHDLSLATTFYRDVLGLPIASQDPERTSFDLPEVTLELVSGGPVPSALRTFPEHARTLIRFDVADVEQTGHELRKRGLKTLGSIFRVGQTGLGAYAADLEGNTWLLYQEPDSAKDVPTA